MGALRSTHFSFPPIAEKPYPVSRCCCLRGEPLTPRSLEATHPLSGLQVLPDSVDYAVFAGGGLFYSAPKELSDIISVWKRSGELQPSALLC